MGLFGRREDASRAHRHTHRHGQGHEKPPVSTVGTTNIANNTGVTPVSQYAFINQRPTIRAWIRTIWLDILTMAIMGAIGLGVYMAPPAPSRNFPVLFQDGEVVYPYVAYPLRKNIIPIWLAAFLASIIPITIFLIFQIRIKSFWDLNNAILGLLYSLINAAVFQVFIKWLIGGLRPHFLAVCQPDPSKIAAAGGNIPGTGFMGIMFDRSICTGDNDGINDALESMPSGHSTAAFAGFVFLFLWMNAKVKLWSNYHPAMWKMVIVYAPLLGAVLIAGSLTIDEFHHWYDVCAGAAIGTIFAFGAYRMVYASIFDWRYNHIPLPRGWDGTGFTVGGGGFGGFETAVWTRKAGWGADGGYGMYGAHKHASGRRSRSRSAGRYMRGAENV